MRSPRITHRRWAALAFVAAAFSITACSDGRSPFGVTLPRDVSPGRMTDDEIRSIVYDRPFRLPRGFYDEGRDPSRPEPYYVNTVSVTDPCCRTARWVELSTEDLDQARAWAELTLAYSNTAPTALRLAVTRRFFHFQGESGPALRVHRASYLDRSGFDRMRIGGPPSTLGTLVARPIDLAAAKGVAEYLWTIDPGRAPWVVSSAGYGTRSEAVHVIHAVSAVFGDWGLCDRLYLNRLEYHVSRATGDIELVAVPIREVVGRCR